MHAPLAVIAALTVFVAPFAQTPAPPEKPAQASPELEAIVAQREFDPEDPIVLEAYSGALGKSGDVDGQVAYLIVALDAYDQTEVDDPAAKDKKLKALSDALLKLDPETSALRGARESYVKDLSWALQLYATNQKKYRNALEVAGRILRYRPDHSLAKSVVDTIKKRNDPALTDEANRLSSLHELSRPRSFLVKWAEAHRDWNQAGVVETDGYIVHSNIGYDVLQLAGRGLDQISRYYSSFYGADRSVQRGKTEVTLCRTRDEWVKEADTPELTDNQGVLAFIRGVPLGESIKDLQFDFHIYGFDPRDVARPLESFWPTLWHEASHQYMMMRTREHSAPPWMQEGMATYFEGAQLRANGEISVGLPSFERLQDLVSLLEAGVRPLDALLAQQQHLPGELYSPAWGLVYYLQHAPPVEGKPRLRELLVGAVKLTSTTDVKGKELLEKAVLKPLGTDLDTFETQWSEWIKDLFSRESSPRIAADTFLEQANADLKAGREDRATEGFTDAMLRVPEDAAALLGLTRIQKLRSDKAKNKDETLKDTVLTYARKAHHAALQQRNLEVEKAAAEIANSVDGAGFKKIADAERTYRRSVETLIAKKVAQDKPKTAIALAGRFVDDVLDDHRAESLASELREKQKLTLERRLRVFDGKTLNGLSAPPSMVKVVDGELVCEAERPRRVPLYVESVLSPLFRLEGDIWFEDPNTVLALNFSQPGQAGSRGYAVRPMKDEDVAAPEDKYMPFDLVKNGQLAELREGFSRQTGVYDIQIEKQKKLGTQMRAGEWVHFRFIRDSVDWLTLEIDGQQVGSRKISTDGPSSSVGVLIYGGKARIKNLHAIEIDRL